MLSRKALLSVCTFAAALGLAVSATAQTSQAQMTTVTKLSVGPQSSAPIAQFVPQQQTRNTKLDYTILNDALNYSVLPLGQSTRRHMSRPDMIDLVRMNRSEQLAFWFNLHNIVMIDQIVQNYPVKRPSSIKVDGVKLDDAKIVNIKGQALSLRDIRERIVYPNWKNPNVIYGFFRGDIGSPALQDFAFTSQNVGATLATIGNEFVNALRGFNEGSKTRNVSRVYDEARDLLLRGTVIIEDIDTSTPAYDPNVDPESSTFKVPPTSGL